MNITPEQALIRLEKLSRMLHDWSALARDNGGIQGAESLAKDADSINWALSRIAELEARDATDCPHIRPYMAAVDDVESFDFWLSRASDAELRCAVALQRGEIDRLRLEPMLAAAPTPPAGEHNEELK